MSGLGHPTPTRPTRSAATERLAWTGLAVLQLLPLWCVELPPMVDLPQHAAQLAMFERMLAGDPRLAEEHTLNWFTPYLAGYLLTWALDRVLPLLVALKLVLSAALLGVPLATRALIAGVGGDRRWALLAFPVAYGYAFHWGFFNFLVAAPLGILYLAAFAGHLRSPGPTRATLLALGGIGLFFCHALIAVFAGFAAGLMALARAPERGGRAAALPIRLAPLVALVPVMAAWTWFATPAVGEAHRVVWNLGLDRPLRLFSGVLGRAPSASAAAGGVLLLALPLLLGARPARRAARFAPLAAAAGFALLLPHRLFGTAFLFERFTLFVLPFWLLGLEREAAPPLLGRLGPGLLAAVPAVLLAGTLSSFLAFDAESRGIRRLLRRLPDGQRVLSVVTERGSAHSPAPVYLHYPAWYQLYHGGTVDFSFAAYFPQLVRYREGAGPDLPPKFEWFPRFRWAAHEGERYDVFVVRASRDLGPVLFRGATRPMALAGRADDWWIYARAGAVPELAHAED